MTGMVFLAESGLSTRAALLTAAGGLVALLLVLELIRQHRLQERYAAVWITSSLVLSLTGIVGLFSSFSPVSDLLGIQDERFALVILALAFVISLLLHLTIMVSRLAEQNVRLAQDLAVLRGELDHELAARGSPEPAAGTEPAESAQPPARPRASSRPTTHA